MVILKIPARLFAIAQWYQNFDQVEDSEVCTLLERLSQTPRHRNGSRE